MIFLISQETGANQHDRGHDHHPQNHHPSVLQLGDIVGGPGDQGTSADGVHFIMRIVQDFFVNIMAHILAEFLWSSGS